MTDLAPTTTKRHARAEGVATANATDEFPIFRAPFAGTVAAVTYAADSAITGVATNNRTVSLMNRGAAGAGSTVVASLTIDNGVNFVAFNPKAVPLSGTPANLVVAEGDILTFRSAGNGTGLADPGGLVVVDLTRA